uniref:Uncharacterized protein n=1 Tax=Selenomonas ruminantium TaxID=971 RepID=Q2PYV3_SELRU|nr:unknown [Selenomonas ruminantium]ABC18252.1 unknown [Selenomonas ruminantium]ABC18257.1 unknown [Selenomonas ruminantium]
MPVKVGGSYVSEAAYSFAKAQATDKKEDSGVMKSLSEKFPNLKFSVGTAPFAGTGTNNVSISPKILKQMEQDPEKRLEYEALIYDIANTDVTSVNTSESKLKAHGFIIEDDGGLRSWGIGEFTGGNKRQQSHLKRSEKKNWWQDMLGKPKEKKKKSALKELWKQVDTKKKETDPKKQDIPNAEKNPLIGLQNANDDVAAILKQNAEKIMAIPSNGNPALAKAYLQNTKAMGKSPNFASTNELTKYLQENFSMVKAGMAKISGKYLQKCLTDEESRLKLFDNLRVAEDAYNNRKDEVGFQGMQVTIDEDGEMTMTSSKTTVSINEDKRRRQIAAAATRGDMQSVVALLEQDLQQLEDGLRLNQCDAAEVEKAKKLLEQAKERMGRLPDRDASPAEQNAMTINMLI